MSKDELKDNPVIGITEYRLSKIIEEAVRRGYEAGRNEADKDEWLTSRAEICKFLSPEKPISPTTFNRNRSCGMYGEAIIGSGHKCKARKSDLLSAIRQYERASIK